VKLLKTLTKLLVSPREATKSVRQNLGKQLRLKMTKNLYLTPAEIDEIICTETKTEVALPSLSEWVSSFVCFFLILFIFVGLLISAFASSFFFFWQALGLVRKIRGKYSAFCREYFESALEVPHVSKVTPFESITGIVKQRAEKDQGWFVCFPSLAPLPLTVSRAADLSPAQRTALVKKATVFASKKTFSQPGNTYLMGRAEIIVSCFFFLLFLFVFPSDSDLFLLLLIVYLLPTGASRHCRSDHRP